MTIQEFVKRNPVLCYFALTFAISWGTLLVMIGLNGMPTTMEQLNAQLPVAIMAYLLGPAIAGLLMTGLVHGRAGLRDLKHRLSRWRVDARFYAVALLVGPSVLIAVPLMLASFAPEYLPNVFTSNDWLSMIMAGIMGGVMVGIFEEMGWTGFAIPMLRSRYSALATGLLVGVIWGGWHVLSTDVWIIHTYTGDLSPPLFVTLRGLDLMFGQLVPFRVLMVWVNDRTGSLSLAMVMHFSLTTCTLIIPSAVSGVSLLILDLALTGVMWAAVAAVIMADHGLLSRASLARRTAQ